MTGSMIQQMFTKSSWSFLFHQALVPELKSSEQGLDIVARLEKNIFEVCLSKKILRLCVFF